MSFHRLKSPGQHLRANTIQKIHDMHIQERLTLQRARKARGAQEKKAPKPGLSTRFRRFLRGGGD